MSKRIKRTFIISVIFLGISLIALLINYYFSHQDFLDAVTADTVLTSRILRELFLSLGFVTLFIIIGFVAKGYEKPENKGTKRGAAG